MGNHKAMWFNCQLALTLTTDDATDDGQSDQLLADAVVHFNSAENCWVAAIDWQALRHATAGPHRRAAPTHRNPRTTSRRSDGPPWSELQQFVQDPFE